MKKDEFVQEVINKDMGKFLDDEFPKDDYSRDRARLMTTRFLIWLRNKYSGQRTEIE
jgi:hypothetical protein